MILPDDNDAVWTSSVRGSGSCCGSPPLLAPSTPCIAAPAQAPGFPNVYWNAAGAREGHPHASPLCCSGCSDCEPPSTGVQRPCTPSSTAPRPSSASTSSVRRPSPSIPPVLQLHTLSSSFPPTGESQLVGYPSFNFTRAPPVGLWTAPPQYPSVAMINWWALFHGQPAHWSPLPTPPPSPLSPGRTARARPATGRSSSSRTTCAPGRPRGRLPRPTPTCSSRRPSRVATCRSRTPSAARCVFCRAGTDGRELVPIAVSLLPCSTHSCARTPPPPDPQPRHARPLLRRRGCDYLEHRVRELRHADGLVRQLGRRALQRRQQHGHRVELLPRQALVRGACDDPHLRCATWPA